MVNLFSDGLMMLPPSCHALQNREEEKLFKCCVVKKSQLFEF
ncbi:hypothetical protein HMPREF9123_0485 [Neisseria bacilliformis ATCC BAA-1200]|uniref:Uncharacterized protein n=1 Tax=Neisseria bacilliformis ATCC BAA-1200 TaxID=888742 RepID=F2B9T1_9NEIS|nr:hypothetical protein HMPREF9123_0485 [Neisseria bacilliformis ATCC BAA-1200]